MFDVDFRYEIMKKAYHRAGFNVAPYNDLGRPKNAYYLTIPRIHDNLNMAPLEAPCWCVDPSYDVRGSYVTVECRIPHGQPVAPEIRDIMHVSRTLFKGTESEFTIFRGILNVQKVQSEWCGMVISRNQPANVSVELTRRMMLGGPYLDDPNDPDKGSSTWVLCDGRTKDAPFKDVTKYEFIEILKALECIARESNADLDAVQYGASVPHDSSVPYDMPVHYDVSMRDYDSAEFASDSLQSQAEAYLTAMEEGRFVGSESENGWILPMHGSYRESCGKWSMPNGCLEADLHPSGEGVVQARRQWCRQLSCPVCGRSAIKWQAMSSVNRMCAAAILLQSDIGRIRKKSIFNHIVVSFSHAERELAKDPAKCRGIIRRHMVRLRKAGLKAALTVFHPWRFTEGLASQYWSPHVHVLGLGYIENTQKGESDHKLMDLHYYGRMHDTRAKRSAATMLPPSGRTVYRSMSTFTDARRVYSTVGYLLSHCGIGLKGRVHAVKYYGEASYNKFRTAEVLSNARNVRDDTRRLGRDILAVKHVEKDGTDWHYVCDRVSLQYVALPKNILNFDIRMPAFGKVVELTVADYRKALEDGTLLSRLQFDSILKDNAPNAKSTGLKGYEATSTSVDAPEHPPHTDHLAIITRTRHVDCLYSEKYAYTVLYVDPATDRLCKHCHAKFRLVLPKGGILPPGIGFDPKVVQTVDPDAWYYWRPELTAYEGLPYIEDDRVKYDMGVHVLPHSIDSLTPAYYGYLQEGRAATVASYVARKIKYNERDANTRGLKATARFVMSKDGVPDKVDGSEMFDLVHETWHAYDSYSA